MNQSQDNNNALQTFHFEGNTIRVVQGDDDQPWFVASDLAQILGYRIASDMVRALDHDERSTQKVRISSDSNDIRRMAVINESGLYSLILSRETVYIKDPHMQKFVQRFQRWVTHDVLPSIRKHGAYATPQTIENIISNPDFGIKLLKTLKNERAQRVEAEKTIEEQKPKVLFADALTTSKSSILVGEFAKILKQNGVEIGQNRLFKWLRSNGYLFSRKGEDWNMPTQRAQERGWFEIKTGTRNNPDGTTIVIRTPKITGKGQQYLVNKFLQQPQLVSVGGLK